jgi:hypothetical protein
VARKKKADPSKEKEAAPRSKESEANKKLLKRVLERAKLMIEADQPNRNGAVADLKFVNEPGAQWDSNMKKEREGRPCLEANTLRINGKRIINEIRANRPQGHVRAVEGGDKEGAELREGLVRNVLNMSDFESITDYEAEYQVDGGLGAWRIDTEYADDSMFDQDIKVNAIKNPLCLYWDPACKDILQKRDAEDWLLIDTMSVRAYEAAYGDAEKFDFSSDADDLAVEDWEEEEQVRVAEYWYKEPYDKELWLVELPKEDGTIERMTVDSTSDEAQALIAQGIEPAKTRAVRCHKIMMCVASGKSILKGPVEVGGAEFPFVVAHGEVKVVDGKVRWWGLHRFSKDAQQIQNVFWSAAAETVALAPKAHTWVTVDQAKGHLESYEEAHRRNIPVRIYNADPAAPGPPQRHPGAEVPVAMMEMVGLSGELIRTTSGLHEASFGEESDEKSGVALARKQRQAQIVTYNFPDNMAKAAKRTGEIILDRIPIVYDAERELRILGVDGAEKYERVNRVVFDPATGKAVRVNDLTAGKYDFYVKTGPSYSSQREEASEIYGEFVQKFPELMSVAGDLIFKASDLPYSDEIAKRMQHLLPPPIQQQMAEGKDLPPEVVAAQAQVQQAMQMVQQQAQLVQRAAMESEQKKAEAEKAAANVQKLIADLEKKQAQFDAHVAKTQAQLVQQGAQLDVQSIQIDGKKQQLDGQAKQIQSQQQQADAQVDGVTQAQEAVAQIDAMAAQFMEAQSAAMAEMRAMLAEIKAKPKVKRLRTERDEHGALIGIPEYDDGSDEPK